MTMLRPALAVLASAPQTTTLRKLWRALTPEERRAAITAALADDENGWVRSTTRSAIAGALRFRPQTVASWPPARLVSEGARLPLDDVQLLSAFLVDLHLGHRRPMMQQFLDALGIENDGGRIDADRTPVSPPDADALATAAATLFASFPPDEVATYFLTLLLQDFDSWQGLARTLKEASAASG